MTEFAYLLMGLAGLYLGSESLVRGAVDLADRYRLPDAIFGMLVLAIGTDLPEIFVAVDASVRSLNGEDLSGIVIGSAIGSSIGQFGLVFGVAGFIGFAARPRHLGWRNTTFLLLGTVALFAFAYDGAISRLEGGLLILGYSIYLYSLFFRGDQTPEGEDRNNDGSALRGWLLLVAGLFLLLISAEVTVAGATAFGQAVGLSNVAVSAVVIGMGSSLPELSVSFVALLKKRGGLSVGNLMGSNVLDTWLVPGLGAVISPLAVPAAVMWVDLPILFVISLLVLGFLYHSRRGIRAPEAATLLSIYLVYVFVRLAGPGS